jgi:hypothetical protein
MRAVGRDAGGAGLRQVEVSGGARVLLGAANDASLYVWELYGRHAPVPPAPACRESGGLGRGPLHGGEGAPQRNARRGVARPLARSR